MIRKPNAAITNFNILELNNAGNKIGKKSKTEKFDQIFIEFSIRNSDQMIIQI
jgi:hypothetical protein